MCRSVHVRLSETEQKETARLSGFLIPVYASVALALFAGLFLAQMPRNGEMIASAGPAVSQTAAR